MLKRLFSQQEVRYGISSAMSFLLDTALYWLFLLLLGMERKSVAQIAARVCSSFFNFNMNKFFAYRKKSGYTGDLLKYYMLCVPQAALTVFLTTCVQNAIGVRAPLAATAVKVGIDAVMFVCSYFVQKLWVFKKKD